MRRTAAVALLLLAGCTTGGVPATPMSIQVPDAAAAYETALSMLRLSGFAVSDHDDRRLFIRYESRVDADVLAQQTFGGVSATARVSYVALQFYPDGRVVAMPTGYHVRGSQMDARLADEIRRVLETLASNLGVSAAIVTESPPGSTPTPPAAE